MGEITEWGSPVGIVMNTVRGWKYCKQVGMYTFIG